MNVISEGLAVFSPLEDDERLMNLAQMATAHAARFWRDYEKQLEPFTILKLWW